MKLASAALLLAVAPVLAEHPTALAPESPIDGASVGRKPRFVVRAEGAAAEGARYRIDLSTDDFRTTAYSFDEVIEPSGWVHTALDALAPRAVYAPRLPIAAGDYRWRVASWDGVTWHVGPDSLRFTVDDLPPADVRALTVRREPERGCVALSWEPVATDVRGQPERIALYHVVRYTTASAIGPIRAARVGGTPVATFEDCDPDLARAPILFYRVVAEDEAGNVPGERY